MRNSSDEQPGGVIKVRCTHCRDVIMHDPHNRHACGNCGSQMAIYNDKAIMIAKNGADGVPLHKLDPKKRKFLIPRN